MATVKKIDDIVRIYKGKKVETLSDRNNSNAVRYIQIDDLRNDNNLKYTTEDGVHVSQKDVVIAWDGANAGTVGYEISGIIGSTLAKLELKTSEVLPEYLGLFLKSKSQYLRDKSTGATIPHISKYVLTNLQIKIPPLDEQKRIVSEITQASKLREKRKQVIDLMEAYINSVFIETFGDPVTNTKGWDVASLGNIGDIVSGVTKGRKFKNKETIMAPYMRVANVQDGYIDLSEVKEIEVLPSDIEKYKLINGDLLLTEGGDPDKLGRGGIWKGEIEDCIHQNHIFRVRVDKDLVNPEYLSRLIGSERGKRYFLKSAKQTTGIATINMTQLREFPVLMTPIGIQNRFAQIVNDIQAIKQKMLVQSNELENQFKALLQKHFNAN